MKTVLVFWGSIVAIVISVTGLEWLLFRMYRVKEGRDRGIKLLSFAAVSMVLSVGLFLFGKVYAHNTAITSPLEDIGSYIFTATSCEKESYRRGGYRGRSGGVSYRYYVVYSAEVDDMIYSYRTIVADQVKMKKTVDNKAKIERKIFLAEDGDFYIGAGNDTVETFLEKRSRWKVWLGCIEIAGLAFFAGFQLLYVVIYRKRNSKDN